MSGSRYGCAGFPSRPDYEVPTTAIVDYLQARPDIDSVMGTGTMEQAA